MFSNTRPLRAWDPEASHESLELICFHQGREKRIFEEQLVSCIFTERKRRNKSIQLVLPRVLLDIKMEDSCGQFKIAHIAENLLSSAF